MIAFEQAPDKRPRTGETPRAETDSEPIFSPWQAIRMRGLSGVVEDGWTVKDVSPHGTVLVAKLRGNGNDSYKIVPLETLRKLNNI
ncbi:MAG: hypothetical protein COW88_00340 [Candidatus Lloydbacteria bacterium CG22_combo_CG10-13_8_21_14_all_47_15]|uniref:Uncharacterized protein n=1 Tax=Candidatus Lloydbacteria bacterium CG22_combo_CG10-13_8_21_14_all_47_15 TaxID=1974635 RepID=A0A2H0CW97_9BACT|nr:MAG: hypothetical protein COW88_00340 [Candidatus Lloydbacteria bacterium CG22_combo_CG10-13_8_21_14_all_47_15]